MSCSCSHEKTPSSPHPTGKSLSIVIIGSGAFGCALANGLAKGKNHKISVHERPLPPNASPAEVLSAKYLPELRKKRPDINVIHELPTEADVVLMAVPTQVLRVASTDLQKTLNPKATVIACCKGLERAHSVTPLEVLRDTMPGRTTGFLAGPNLAKEVLEDKPTCASLAFEDLNDAIFWSTALTGELFTLIPSRDVSALQILAAAKNVLAVGCGMIEGAGLGVNARGAYLALACTELRLYLALLEDTESAMWTVGGIGDLILTCTSPLSRNYSFGFDIGKAGSIEVGAPKALAEGAWTASIFKQKANQMAINLPALTMVSDILEGKSNITEAVEQLFQTRS